MNITDDTFTIVRVHRPQRGVVQAHQHGIPLLFARHNLLDSSTTSHRTRAKPNLHVCQRLPRNKAATMYACWQRPVRQLLGRGLHELHARRTLDLQFRQRRAAGKLDAELLVQQHPARTRGHRDRFLESPLKVDSRQQEVVPVTSVRHSERVGVPGEVRLRYLDVYLLHQSDSCGMTESSLGGVHLDIVEGYAVRKHCIASSAEMMGAPTLDHGVHRLFSCRRNRKTHEGRSQVASTGVPGVRPVFRRHVHLHAAAGHCPGPVGTAPTVDRSAKVPCQDHPAGVTDDFSEQPRILRLIQLRIVAVEHGGQVDVAVALPDVTGNHPGLQQGADRELQVRSPGGESNDRVGRAGHLQQNAAETVLAVRRLPVPCSLFERNQGLGHVAVVTVEGDEPAAVYGTALRRYRAVPVVGGVLKRIRGIGHPVAPDDAYSERAHRARIRRPGRCETVRPR